MQRVRDRLPEQQPVVHEREAVPEAAEHEHRQQEPEAGHQAAQHEVDRHAAEPEKVGAAPLVGLRKRAASEPSTVPKP